MKNRGNKGNMNITMDTSKMISDFLILFIALICLFDYLANI
jgi:hypothetical protein